MKKILITLFLFFTFILPMGVYSACNIGVDSVTDIGTSLDDCLAGSKLVNGEDARIEIGVKDLISSWVKNIGMVLGILAVGSIVYGSLLMTLSTGEDEKIKKAKDIIKWGIIGFIGLISTSTVILLVVNIMYSLDVS